jgi:hypothetical protein
VPAGCGFHRRQKLTDYRLKIGDGCVQALDQGIFGERGDTPFPALIWYSTGCADGTLTSFAQAATRCSEYPRGPRQCQPQEVGTGPHTTRALERPGLARRGFQVHMDWQPRQKGREIIDRRGRCFKHLRHESYRFEPCQRLS